MPVIRRKFVDALVGQLKTAISSTATQLVCDQFASLPAGFFPSSSPALAMPLVIADDMQNLVEIVLVTARADGSNVATVTRGAFGTTARAWDAGVTLRVDAGMRDLGTAYTRGEAAALADSYVGMENVDETGILSVQTAAQGMQALARVMPGGIGSGVLSGFTPGSNRELLSQALTYRGTTSTAGYINVPLPAGRFPSGIIAVLATPIVTNTGAPFHIAFYSAYDTGGQNGVGPNLQLRCFGPSGATINSTAVAFSLLALGV